jgi:DNA-binding response OmpR family regulator
MTALVSTLYDVQGQSRGRILVVDDEDDVRALLARYLETEGYQVDQAADARSAFKALAEHPPDLVLLDVMLSPDDGLEVLSRLRKESDVGVILLTGKGTEADRVVGLKLGADDYVVKPFSPAEVEARIASVLRRVRPATTPSFDFDGLSIDMATREVRVGNELVSLTAKEFDLLAFLASSPRQVFSRDQLLDQVWNSSSEWQSAGTVTEHIRRLRNRIELDVDHPRWITTVWGVGYRFNP